MYNIQSLLNKKPKENKLLILVITAFLGLIILFVYNISIYDTYKFVGYTSCLDGRCLLYATIPYDEANIFEEELEVETEKKCIYISDKEYGEFKEENGVIMQEIILETNLAEEKVYVVNIKYNKQRMIEKIKKAWRNTIK